MKELRPAIIRAHEQGKGVREIASFLNMTPMMVSRAIKRFKETGSNQDRPKGRPEKTARNRRNIQRTKEMNQRNSTTKALVRLQTKIFTQHFPSRFTANA